MWTMIALVVASVIAAPADVMCNATILTSSWDLLKSARYGQSERERAAFVVWTRSGELELVRWPYDASRFHATYAGAIPAGAIAIVHTHPNAYPSPSAGDARLAQRTSLPVYVLTRSQVTWTDGRQTHTACLGDWNPVAGGLQSDVSPNDALRIRRVCS
jgi:proteasome lid subunit RPN8/RPN11